MPDQMCVAVFPLAVFWLCLVTTVTLPVSKDNLMFGVQTLSKRGFASLASFALPLRR